MIVCDVCGLAMWCHVDGRCYDRGGIVGGAVWMRNGGEPEEVSPPPVSEL